MKKLIITILIASFVFCCLPLAGNAYFCSANEEGKIVTQSKDLENLDIKAKSFVLMDKTTGNVLESFNENEKLPVASMTKMMVLDLVMREIDAGRLNLNKSVTISEFAASMGGSQCFLDAGKDYSIYELIKSVVVASANDSTVALAEAVSGSEELFVLKMNERANELGMNDTNFVNSTGLDESGHLSSAHDMAIIMREIADYELLKELGKVWMYDMNHSGGRITSLTNTNRLIKSNRDVVLAKTGHTDEAGFCVTAYAKRDGEELIACVIGEESSPLRFLDCTKLLNYGFSNYETRVVVDSLSSVAKINIKGANIKELDIYPTEDVLIMSRVGEELTPSINVNAEKEIKAPTIAGEKVGEMIVEVNGEKYNIPLEIRVEVEEIKIAEIIKKIMHN